MREEASGPVEDISGPHVPDPPSHLGEFAHQWNSLSDSQGQIARRLLDWVAEMSAAEERPAGWIKKSGAYCSRVEWPMTSMALRSEPEVDRRLHPSLAARDIRVAFLLH